MCSSDLELLFLLSLLALPLSLSRTELPKLDSRSPPAAVVLVDSGDLEVAAPPL